MDEVRAGGSCEACKARKMTMAQILGDCISRQFAMIRGVNSQAEVFAWSDMLDPNHNAHGNYYLVDGDYAGSWKYVPEDLRIVCWYYEKRKESLSHFSGLASRPWPGPTTMATRWRIPRAGWRPWIRPRGSSASCTQPGKTSTSCSAPLVISSPGRSGPDRRFITAAWKAFGLRCKLHACRPVPILTSQLATGN